MSDSDERTRVFSVEPIRQRRAFEDVVVQLRRAIVERRLHVGDKLPHERELASIFNISRQSLREGLRMLEGFGMLSARRGAGPDSGWIVTGDGRAGLSVLLDLHMSLQGTPIWDVLEIRESIEILAVRSAAERAEPAERAEILETAIAMRDVFDRATFLQADTDFHIAIARKSGNGLAPLFMESIRDAIARAMLAAFERIDDWEAERGRLVTEHVAIAEAVATGRSADAAHAMHEHIHGFYGRVLREHEVYGRSLLEPT